MNNNSNTSSRSRAMQRSRDSRAAVSFAPPLDVPLPDDDAAAASAIRPPDIAAAVPRYYTPPPKPAASGKRKRSNTAPETLPATDTALHNIVTMTAGHAGVGSSVLAAMLSWELANRGLRCALVDVDFTSGCLDLLLGVEREPGLRFNEVEAPLGQIEGEALHYELTAWEGVRVLPYHPWDGQTPEWWEVQAALRALAQTNDVVIVDAGQGELVEAIPELRDAAQLMVVELSVLGLARAKAHRNRLVAWKCATPDVVGIEPRGAPRGRGNVGIGEAEDYLAAAVLGPVRPSVTLCGDVLEGLGIRTVPKGSRKTVDALADLVERAVHPRSRGRGNGASRGRGLGGNGVRESGGAWDDEGAWSDGR
ncbi:cobyric acid synthase [Bifidobacterium olomucense]|nr:cobyric acid synthase [Bifidobacterium sp. DSM 109959]